MTENREFYVKYKDNQAVKIETHYTGENTRKRALRDVADLIKATTVEPTRRLLDLPEQFRSLTLHYIEDGMESAPLEPDFPLTAVKYGATAKTALIVKSKNDMDVDSSPTTSGSSRFEYTIRIDGIDIDTEHLERKQLVSELDSVVSLNAIVLISSPAGSGKSSSYKLYKAAARNKRVIGISCLKKESLFEVLTSKGIDLEKEKIGKMISNKTTVIFLDDAQAKYGEARFWEHLVKSAGIWLPANIRFIISATHSLSEGVESPVEFV
eukprot:NODE_60_length_25605_cov_0.732377.p9 type:complete len:267 gc:universal NODE_60_length_25605_cov_0.732377:12163-11363(-)